MPVILHQAKSGYPYTHKNNKHGLLTRDTETSKCLALNLLLSVLLCACVLTFPLRAHAGQVASAFANTLAKPTPAECLFNWAELNYPALFAPAGSTQFWTVYSYRFYPDTNAYLGVNSVNNHIYYLGPDGVLQDEGPLADWTPKAGCPVPQTSPAECLFNWAELNYPDLFAPIGSPWIVSSIDWTSRYYALTNAYLRIQSSDTHVYYQGPDGLLQDEGPLADWTPKASCRPPVANAGPDQTAFVGTAVTLDGSASSDLDGNLITYQWTLTQKPANSQTGLSNPTALHPTLVIDKPGTYVISLVINDGQFDSAPATVIVNTQNSKPVANAGAAQSGKVGGTLALNGSASRDVDGDALTYHWTLPAKPQNSSAQLINPNTVSPSLTLDKPGNYTVQLTVNDGKAGSTPATVVLSTVNSRPVAKAGPAQSILLTTPAPSVQLDGSGSSDADSDPLSFRWALITRPAGSLSVLLDPLAPSSRFTPDFIGDYVAQLIVNDGHVDSDPNTVQITATAPPPPQNQPPQINSAPVTTATAGQLYNYDVDAADPDAGDTLNYILTLSAPGMTIDSQTGLIQWTPSQNDPGIHPITVKVDDGKSGNDDQSFTVTVAAPGQISVPDLRNLSRAAAETAIHSAKLTVGTPGFIHNPASPGSVILQIPDAGTTATAGSTVTLTISLGPDLGLPPDPVIVAPPVDTGVATVLANASKFLYTGSNPIQTGIAQGTINPVRAAVIRGRVLTRDNQPLAGAAISVLNHPEFGQTLSRADGLFDMAVNGGGLLTVNYQKSGFLSAQRQINAPWQDFALLPDVVMIPLDTQVTAIDLNAPIAMQVARGGPVTDSDGTRQAILLIPQGTTAQVVLPDGSTQSITTLNVRATEYTVGANGPKAMPAALPPTSGYTYAVELSADEAIAAGAKNVNFSQPLLHYVENFMSFPVGTAVPTGFYDRDKAAWVPSTNGRVIRITAIAGGMASVDTVGAGLLSALVISDAERQQLAQLYPVGQELWRVPVTHFTPWDHNWPFGPPDDATKPQVPEPDSDDQLDDPTCSDGSIIECENQTLGENIALTGTPHGINYRSSRTSGRTAARQLRIDLSGANVPASLKRIDLEVEVAGRMFQQSFAAGPNLKTTFTWDGLDAYGRSLQGIQPARITIGYVYNAVYKTPAQLSVSFAAFGVSALAGNTGRSEVTLSKRFETSLIGSFDFPGLGGWTLSPHHVYDPAGRILHLGNGGRRSADSVASIITTVAGNGDDRFSGDGGPATQASFSPRGIALRPDGRLYIADSVNNYIRQVGPDGIITTVAGNGVFGYSGDGGPATLASLSGPNGVAVGPDGDFYIADVFNNRIRRVNSGGIITTVAGNGASGFSGDGGPATQATLNRPYGIAVGPDGSLYIADVGNNRVRRVGPDGIIITVAGNRFSGFSGDGGLAAQASLANPFGVAVEPDGSLYIADSGNNRIRRVGPDGIIITVAGNGTEGFSGDGGPASQASLADPFVVAAGQDGSLYIADAFNGRIRRVTPGGLITTVAGNGGTGFSGDGGPATQAPLLFPDGVAVAPDGSFYIADFRNRRIRIVGHVLSGLAVAEVPVASEDGRELYVFDGSGRHLRTLEALTGATLREFTYDAAGRLAQMAEKTGGADNLTVIERDAAGNPAAIVTPFGQRTMLGLDTNGFLASITNPAGERVQLASTAGGLLTSLTDARGKTSTFTYDNDGRLIRDTDPAGGTQNLVRTATSGQFTVTRATALSRTTTYKVEDLPGRTRKRTVTAPDGTQDMSQESIDAGKTTITAPDGTVTSLQLGPDPRFNMQSPVTSSLGITLPGGPTLTASNTRTAALSNPLDPLTLTSLTATSTVAGRTTTSTYTVSTKTQTTTTPAGRTSSLMLDTLGRPVTSQAAGFNPVDFTYDSRGRLASVTQGSSPNDRTASFVYNASGYLDTLTDPLGRKLSYTYDAAGRVASLTLPDGREIAYAYDAGGNLTSLTPPGRPGHLFHYTDRDQTTEYEPPLVAGTGSTLYDYDLDKDLTKITRPDGQTLEFGYNSAGQLSTLTLPTGQISYAYSATTGKMTGVTAPDGGTIAYTYQGPLLSRTAWTGTLAGTVSRAYDNNFRVSSLSVNDANAIDFQYDADSLLTQAGNLALTRSAQNGLLTGTALGSLTDSYSYDGFAEVMAYEAKYSVDSLLHLEYDHDKLGRITQKRQIQGGVTHAFDYGYDTAGRLVEVKRDGVVTSSYGYDTNGNRTHLNGTEIAHYDGQDRLLDYQGATYQYTANGELLQKTVSGQTTHYDYDVLGNLRKVILPGGTTIDYLIDGENRRVGKKVNGTMVQGFIYQDPLKPIAELDGSNNVVSRFVYASHINVPDYMIKDGVTYRIVTDHLGSPRLVVNTADGTVAQRMDFDEFGNVTADTNPGFQPFGFAGGVYDRHTGLVRFGARDYDAIIGRWTAKDLLMFGSMDTNFYRFVLSDPINFIDIDGLSPWKPSAWDSIFGGVGAIAVGNEIGLNLVSVVFESSVAGAAAGVGGVFGAGLAGYGIGSLYDWLTLNLELLTGVPLTPASIACILTNCQPEYDPQEDKKPGDQCR